MKISLKLIIPTVMAFTLIACGGSSGGGSKNNASAEYNGKTTPAEFSNLTAEQAESVGTTSASVIYEAINFSDSDEFLGGIPFAANINTESQNSNSVHQKSQTLINKILIKSKAQTSHSPLSNQPMAFMNGDRTCDGGGTETFKTDANEKSGKIIITMTSKNCKEFYGHNDEDYEITNGTAVMTMTITDSSTTIKLEFKNIITEYFSNGIKETSKMNGYYQVSINGEFDEDEDIDFSSLNYTAKWDITGNIDGKSVAAKGEMNCSSNGCSLTAHIKAEDGKTYKVEDFTITGNGSPTIIRGKIYHPDYGYYNFLATFFDNDLCEEGSASPFKGTATFTDNDSNLISYTSTDCGTPPTIE